MVRHAAVCDELSSSPSPLSIRIAGRSGKRQKHRYSISTYNDESYIMSLLSNHKMSLSQSYNFFILNFAQREKAVLYNNRWTEKMWGLNQHFTYIPPTF